MSWRLKQPPIRWMTIKPREPSCTIFDKLEPQVYQRHCARKGTLLPRDDDGMLKYNHDLYKPIRPEGRVLPNAVIVDPESEPEADEDYDSRRSPSDNEHDIPAMPQLGTSDEEDSDGESMDGLSAPGSEADEARILNHMFETPVDPEWSATMWAKPFKDATRRHLKAKRRIEETDEQEEIDPWKDSETHVKPQEVDTTLIFNWLRTNNELRNRGAYKWHTWVWKVVNDNGIPFIPPVPEPQQLTPTQVDWLDVVDMVIDRLFQERYKEIMSSGSVPVTKEGRREADSIFRDYPLKERSKEEILGPPQRTYVQYLIDAATMGTDSLYVPLLRLFIEEMKMALATSFAEKPSIVPAVTN